jgi:hypothetical protein
MMPPSAAAAPAPAPGWRRLGTPRAQLTLAFTLPTGQSFRWRQTAADEFTGVVGRRVVQLRQEADDVAWRVVGRGGDAAGAGAEEDAAALADYFNLGVDLAALYDEWAAADARFAKVGALHGRAACGVNSAARACVCVCSRKQGAWLALLTTPPHAHDTFVLSRSPP